MYSNYNVMEYDKKEDLELVYEDIKNTDIIELVERIYDNEISEEQIIDNELDNKNNTIDLKNQEDKINKEVNKEVNLMKLNKRNKCR